ncbi:suppressor of fused domain protein [Mycobacterium malmoense]|uniref:Suppressor of fused protein (SUFU) n=1 Tax=Mycobacterium malmoense TaxID=1780 RepID=A0ABX3SR95_MYCMA|nr:suppressor of fused domain protein [Mycobacterium malmoense]ORA82005.1 Suppressor of fused protein (SUFU) [Mycobacterium malmoense]QZA16545.1 suppressor of fused domain protein [Mycobacterium malmoense]UNB93347.1 suppressor of fused domain protein [Mycobacterium malmoense]
MTRILEDVRAHLRGHFAGAEPDSASVTFLGAEPIEVLRFRERANGPEGTVHYVSLGCSRRPMADPTEIVADPRRGPRAEVALRLRDAGPATGIARSLAIIAATPAVDGVVLAADALIDLGAPLWASPSRRVPFTAVLLGHSDIPDLPLEPPREPVKFLAATPITATEAAWVRLKGASEGAHAMRQAWQNDGVDVLDPNRPAAQPD